MLEKLATIPWGSLSHCYGNATQIPRLIRALASKGSRRSEALQELWSFLWHQGSVYEATAYAVPFLCELLRSPDLGGKVGILNLIQAIGSATHERTPLDTIWRHGPAPKYPGLTDDVEQQGMCAEQDCKKALAAEVESLMSLLTDGSPQLRAGAAFTLLSCAEQFAVIEPRLRRRIDEEKHSVVKAALIHIWARLDNGANSKRVKKKLAKLSLARNEKRLVRLVACLGLVPLVPFGPDSRFSRYLAKLLRSGGASLDRLHQGAGGGFELSQCLANRHELKLQLFFALAEKPTRYWKEHILFQLENLCRERRSSFPAVVEVLGRMLSDPDPEFRVNVAWRLSGLGTWVRFAREPLLQALTDSNADVAIRAAICLSKTRDPAPLPLLIAELAPQKHTDPPGGEIAEDTPPMRFLEIELARGRHVGRLRVLIEALCPYGAAAAAAVPHLRTLLATRGAQIQNLVVNAAAHIGKPAADLVPSVAALLKKPATQGAAAAALALWGPVALSATPALVRFLDDFPAADRWAKTSALEALGKLGPSAAEAVPILQRCLRDADGAVQGKAAVALWRIAPETPGVLAVLIDELRARIEPGWATHGCVQAVMALEELGPAAIAAAPLLKKLLEDPDGWSRVHAARALWKIGTRPELILPVLINDLLCQPLGIGAGRLAAECLAEIGPPAMAAVPRIEAILAREDTFAHQGTDWVECDETYRDALTRALHSISRK